MGPFSNAKPISDEKLIELLTKMLEEAVGTKVNKSEINMIVGIAMEMLKTPKPNGEKGLDLTSKDIFNKDSEVSKQLGATLVASTAAAMLMTHQKDKLHGMLDKHKQLANEMKALKPGTPEYEAKRGEVNDLKKDIKNTLKELNRMDPNPERRDAFERNLEKDSFFDELTNPNEETKAVQNTMKKGDDLDDAQKNTLTLSLINLFGMDPRVAGAGLSPVQSVIGNEMGIPDNYPAYTAYEPLHALSEDIITPVAEGQSHSKLDTMEGAVASMAPTQQVPDKEGILDTMASQIDNVVESVIDNNQDLRHEPPTLTRG